MPWLQLALDSDREAAPQLEQALLDCGALSVTLQDLADDPQYEPGVGEQPLWQATRVTGLFEHDHDTAQLMGRLAAVIAPQTLPPHEWQNIEDQQWERAWIDDFQPMQFGRRLWICPSWTSPPEADAVNLLLDPGLAFGTGTHPTTALCLEAIDCLSLSGKTVIDYGCGSGVLGIAALLLGADKVFAVDNDPQALIATRDNGERNGIPDDKLITLLPDDLPDDIRADVMLANILAAPLIELAPRIAAHTKAGGPLLLSGILREQAAAVSAAYTGFCTTEDTNYRDEWTRLTLRKNRD